MSESGPIVKAQWSLQSLMTKLLAILALAALKLYSAAYIEPVNDINYNEGRRVVPVVIYEQKNTLQGLR